MRMPRSPWRARIEAKPKRSAPELGSRSSSYPFVSGDTFRLTADLMLDGSDVKDRFEQYQQSRNISTVFVEIPFFQHLDNITALTSFLDRHTQFSGRLLDVLIHNGDLRPNDDLLGDLAQRCRVVWCVNAHDGIPGVSPLPIGLENAHHGTNGVLRDFLSYRTARDTAADANDRRRPLLATFRTSTNPSIRGPLEESARRSRHGFISPDLTPAEHRNELLNSKLVLSPPGNGPDCHRTWEAIYLGAIPVVQRGSIASSLIAKLPVLELDRIEDVLLLADDEIDEIHRTLQQLPIDRALMPYWIRRLERND
jgi:hypothetical protein